MDIIDRDYCLFNGQIVEKEQFDSGFIYQGTTVYEVIKVKDCVPIFVEEYLKRVENSLRAVDKEQYFEKESILEYMRKIITINCVNDLSHLKISFSFDNQYFGRVEDIFAMYFLKMPIPLPKQLNSGVSVVSMKAKRDNPNVKIFLPELRKRAEELIEHHKIFEVILVDEHNQVTEGSRSNLFFIKDGQLYTADLHKVLPGITRKKVIEIARRHRVEVFETSILYEKLNEFDAAFLTGTSRKIVPIKRIDNLVFDVNNELVRNLMQWYDCEIDKYVEEHRLHWQCISC